ncbi:P-loop containing nucleoside triphosphate hydrolase protein [Kockovaella imperatae]|uniref:p-loop containing nucleoside triphosphate hydrolase protein n=1 Tax=Kockovaella imperatae TaxID=4999 RepID=A0A1Y1UEH9_9TREE|nr:P-loop containing nucleoside triphosphate hydrolase protein [Kockovaella imperatae]ORX35937.1 P-loop containing nucleoside triphosphate hydrolase protein [Kockovaella imperatae]
MPRIRKKTSNRQSTAQRNKISRKAGETRKKNKKAAKKNPQWKSKKKADPGIPNSFPYKDQILAEVAEERRQAEAAKIARKEASRSKDEEKEEDTPGIASIHSSSVYSAARATSAASPSEEEEDVPALVDTSLATLQDVIDRADVILQVVDARDIAGGRNVWIENLLKDAGVYGLIINKADLVPRESIQAWLPSLPANTFIFSSPQEPSTSSSSSASALGRTELLAKIQSLAESGIEKDEHLRIALVGLPSVGKTSVFNALLPSSAPRHPVAPLIPPVSSAKTPAPTTKAPVEALLTLNDSIKVGIIDTPGWDLVPEELEDEDEDMDEDEENQAKWDALEAVAVGDVLRRNLGRVDRIKDVEPLASYIVQRSNAQDLMLLYNVPYFQAGDVEAFLRALARANGRMKKGDQPDMDAGARILLRDWALNQFPYYCMPAVDKDSVNDASGSSRTELDGVLELLKSRKEMKAGARGLVRFKPGPLDNREVILDDDYTAAFAPSDDEDDEEDEDGEESDDDDMEDGDEEDEDDIEEDGDIELESDEEDAEEEEMPRAPPAHKSGGATGPKKSVSFGNLPVRPSEGEENDRPVQKSGAGKGSTQRVRPSRHSRRAGKTRRR